MKVGEKDIVMKLQDTAGQEKYRSIANSYYKGSNGAYLVFDLTDDTRYIASHAVSATLSTG